MHHSANVGDERRWILSAEVAEAQQAGRPIVALESTLIAHGLPWPTNWETALEAEAVIRSQGAVPATIAVLAGEVRIGLSAEEIRLLATSSEVRKASRRDLGWCLARRVTAATTVAATMTLAHQAGIAVFATGGIGGVHPQAETTFDISADLIELARVPVLVVCAGAKSILDLPRTLEVLETLGVPVWGYRTDTFPAFYLRSAGLPLSARCDSADEIAAAFRWHRSLGGSGAIVAQPIADEVALSGSDFHHWLNLATQEAESAAIRGPALTPFLLRRLAELSAGRTLQANRRLIVDNARLAAEIALQLLASV